jgi:hypothetical protein
MNETPEPTRLEKSASDAEQKRLRESRERKVRSAWVSFVGRIIAQLVGAIASVTLGLILLSRYSTGNPRTSLDNSIASLQAAIKSYDGLSGRVEKNRTELAAFKEEMQRLPQGTPQARAVGELLSRVESIDKRLSAIERVLVASPETALSVPMMRQEMTNLKDQHQRDSTALAAEVTRFNDNNKWVLGLIVAALMSLTVTNLFGKKKD